MAEASLLITLESYIKRRADLNADIARYQSQKMLATYNQADVRSIQAQEESELRAFYKSLYECDSEYSGKYADYTEIPEFEEEMQRIAAKYQEQLEEIAAWETILDSQITTASAELEEVNAYIDSLKSMLNSNIQEDYNFSLGG